MYINFNKAQKFCFTYDEKYFLIATNLCYLKVYSTTKNFYQVKVF
jgi:hypothetical protein